MRRELQLEYENTIPIQENLDRVAHGDLLISDMYLSGHEILSLVRGAGLDKQVSIYQSNGDKHSGKVWDLLAGHRPSLHLGDAISDSQVPQARGYRCELYQGSTPTPQERQFQSLGLLMREVRLRNNPSRHKPFFVAANQLNSPWSVPCLRTIAPAL